MPFVKQLLFHFVEHFHSYGNTAQSAFGISWKICALISSLFLEVHKVHLRKSAFIRTQIFSGSALAELCGIALMIFFALNALLKLPLSPAFLDSASFAAYLMRALRCAVILFVEIALCPLLSDRIGKKNGQTA